MLSQWSRERKDLDPSPMGIVGRISRASRYIDHLLERDYLQFGLNGGDFDVLATLRRSGPPYRLTPTALYRASMLSSGAMTNRLDRLEGAGYVERIPHPEDRRGLLVALTQAGREKIDAAVTSHVRYEQQMLSALNSNERHTLARLLRQLLLSFGDEAPLP